MSVETIASILQSGAAVGAVLLGWSGLRTWREQLLGTAEYELARRLLRAVFEVRDQIAAVRNSFISVGEMSAAFSEAGVEPKAEGVGLDDRTDELVYQRRWRALVKARSALGVELLEAEVLWGPAMLAPAAAFDRCIAEMYSVVVRHLRDRRAHNAPRDKDGEAEERREAILYGDSTEPASAAFSDRILTAVGEFERLLRPHLHARIPVKIQVRTD